MSPELVGASQETIIGPARCTGLLHVLPPSVEERKPTLSWQVLVVQAAFG
jgi:hypothetical protein